MAQCTMKQNTGMKRKFKFLNGLNLQGVSRFQIQECELHLYENF
jgi:hypothetical protein